MYKGISKFFSVGIDIRAKSLIFYLRLVSASYLSIPIIIFLVSYLRPIYSIILILILWYSLYLFLRTELVPPNKRIVRVSFLKESGILLILILFVILSGAGNFMYQNFDYIKHNAMLSDMINRDFPVYYEDNGKAVPLVYYIAYYLPASVVGKLIGFRIAEIFIFFWTLLGLWFIVAWISVITGKRAIWAVLIFLFFSGLDIIGNIFQNHTFVITDHLEWWVGRFIWQFSSNATLLFWVPQHALGGWLISAMIIFESMICKNSRNFVFLWALSPLWSVFISIGLLPFVLLALFNNKIKKTRTFQNIVGAGTLLSVVGLFFLSSNGSSQLSFIWESLGLGKTLLLLPLFFMLEAGAYIFFMRKICRTNKVYRSWLTVSAIFLFCILFLKFGAANDLVMRASIPALFFICISVIMFMDSKKNRSLEKAALIALLVIGAFTPIMEMQRSLSTPKNDIHPDSIQAMEQGLKEQYLGRTDSFFFKYLAKQHHDDKEKEPIYLYEIK
ncbi:MAG: hypothetical protein KKF44_11705 [Nanoarchaeota archaeon]|nr:hypothetical protein [Nanoarchaeota archaeon]